MSKKVNQVGKFWGHKHPKFKEYSIDPKSLKKFNGKHPLIIKDWLKHFAEKNYIPDVHYRPSLRDLRHRIMMKIESFFKLDLTKKHFKVIR
jgi:hypothetical protein